MTNNPQLPTQNRLLIIVATYNEIENLPALVEKLEDLLPKSDILVIDDNSPDGTGNWCDDRTQTDSRISVLHRSGKLGLGSAAIAGFRYGLQHTNEYDLLATMDADFSHDPDSLVQLVRCLEQDINHDFGVAIGSRYVRGGRIVNWPLTRKLSSRAVNLAARVLLGLKSRDNSGAFRVYRRSTLQVVDVDAIQSQSYAYLEEILWRIRRAGISTKELPITFRDRQHGQSKTSIRLGLNVFWHLLKIRLGLVK